MVKTKITPEHRVKSTYKHKGATHVQMLFAVAAVALWNNLTTVIKTCVTLVTFKRLLKTHFFCTAYLCNSTWTLVWYIVV